MAENTTWDAAEAYHGDGLTAEEKPGLAAHILTGCLIVACLLTLAVLAGLAYGLWRWAL